jgi:hypothetical protein
MARRELTYTVTTPGRDLGKVFILTEMSALQAERWAMRAFLALAAAGADIPEGIEEQGFVGLVTVGLSSFKGVSFYDAEPLLDEMLGCVRVVPDPGNPAIVRAMNGQDDVEEVATLLELRREVLRLHVDFSKVAALLTSRAATKPPASPTTPTSPD